MKLREIALPAEKAGMMPYVHGPKGPEFYFMIPSDSRFGGPQPGIAKGGVDKGETVLATAFRETKEELGLRQSNIVDNTVQLAWKGKIQGKKEAYVLTVYVCEVRNQKDFKKPDHEVDSRVWMTAKEFAKKGRKSQVHIVNAANRLLTR
jgi:8-oxo-dGTP pyrophosphatase MutT (NUDIX family)